MRGFLSRLLPRGHGAAATESRPREEGPLDRQVSALFGVLANLYGPDKLVLKAGKLDALAGMRSTDLRDRVLALQRLVHEDPTIPRPHSAREIPELLARIEDELAERIARRSVEDKLERKINERMQQRHEEYVREIKLAVLREDTGPENAQTLKRYAVLEKLESQRLARSVLDMLRPQRLADVVGQERAVRALLTKIASPFPQHVLLYGPPGVGKTTAARLVLEEAIRRPHTPFRSTAPFVEVDGTTLRWDPREVTNPLIGSVHDPIYQGARRELADTGIPEPKLGLVTDAHGGILFIDEIGELDPLLQTKLLKVLEDKRVSFDSSYYDPNDPNVPKYVKKLFEEGAPADFILIGATTRQPDEINPALRSRCAEVFFEPLGPAEVKRIVAGAAERLGVALEDGVADLIAEHTVQGRKAVGLLADAYGVALERRHQAGESPIGPLQVTLADVREVVQMARLSPARVVPVGGEPVVGRIFGLGVHGYLGSVLEVEAVAFPARERGKGSLRFNDAAGTMFKDSVFNAASVVRRVAGLELADFDVHCNVVGGGRVDGPSAGAAVCLAVLSALTGRPARQDIGVTGELSVQGALKPVGGIFEKVYAARQAGLRRIAVPEANRADVPPDPGVEVVLAASIDRLIEVVLAP